MSSTQNKKKICFILPSFYKTNRGGAEIQVGFIIDKLLTNSSYKIFYICRFFRKSDLVNGVTVFQLKPFSLFRKYIVWFTDFFQVLYYLKKIKPDMIYCRVGTAYVGIAAIYIKFMNKKTRLIFHIALQDDVEKFKIKKYARILFDYIDKKFLEYGIRNANYIIGQAEYQNKLLKQNYKQECSIIIPNFHPIPKKKEKAKKEYPIKILWVSNFKLIKQPEIFISLAKQFKKKYPYVKFIMIGRAAKNSWMDKIIADINALPNLTYLGELALSETNNLFSASHIFVNTSLVEGFPNTFIQAMMRKSVIVSLNVDPDDILKNNNIGFHSKSFENLIRDVELLINDNTLRDKMAKRAYEYVINNHSLNNVDKIIDIFDDRGEIE